MKRNGWTGFLFGAVAAMATVAGGSFSLAGEVLVNGSLEGSASPPGWTLDQSITGLPGASVNASEQVGFANQPMAASGQLGLLLRPFAGNVGAYDDENHAVNLTLSQIAGGAFAGQQYRFSGWSKWGGSPEAPTEGYSGGVSLLHTGSPSDPTPSDLMDPATVDSPTETYFELAFLNSSNVVLGTPTLLDLRTVQMNDNTWREHSITATAPAGSNKIRVRMIAENMVDNYGFQDTMFDNFSLVRTAAPTQQMLVNANLNTQGAPFGFELVSSPCVDNVCAPVAAFRDFANRTPGGQQGLWLKSFANTTDYDPDVPTVDGSMLQTVSATAGAHYEFSAWTAWEHSFSGGLDPANSNTLMRMEFLDASNALIGSALELDLYDAGMRNDQDGASNNIEPEDWQQFSLEGVAPAGTENVRVSIVGTGMFNTFAEGFPQSAFFDDFSLIETLSNAEGVPGDFNDDGSVDAADYVMWRKLDGTSTALPNDGDLGVPVGNEHYDLWAEHFGETAGGGSQSAAPEPSSALLFGIGLSLAASAWRRR